MQAVMLLWRNCFDCCRQAAYDFRNLQCRKDVLPDEIYLSLHILDVGGGDNHSVLVRYDDDVLTIGAIRSESVVTASPHLIAISPQPVAGLFYLLH